MHGTKTILTTLATCICLSVVHTAMAQEQITVKGIISDSLEQTPLDSSKIIISQQKQQVTTFSNLRGEFQIQIAPPKNSNDSLLVFIHKPGYNAFYQKLPVPKSETDLGTFFLTPESKILEDVVIRSRIPPIIVRNDTTEYVVDSFQRKTGATIGDVLKTLPGIEVDADGNITHNGKPVTKILVNGEDFFGGKKEIALEHLPADLVARLQVLDSKTQEQIFSGLQASGEEKTINITIKPGVQAFGSTNTGLGTSSQLNGSVMANVLKEKKHLGILSNAKYQSISGLSNQQLQNGSLSGNVHYRQSIREDLKIIGSANLTNTRSMQESKRKTEQFFRADSSFITDSDQFSDQNNKHYQGNITIDFKPSKKFNSTLHVMYSGSETTSTFETNTIITEYGKTKNESARTGITKTKHDNLSASLHIGKAFDKKGRTLTLNMKGSYAGSNNQLNHAADNLLYQESAHTRREMLRQQVYGRSYNYNVGATVSYIEPLSQNLRLQLSQKFEISQANNLRNTFNVDSLGGETIYDSTYSNNWNSGNITGSTQLSMVYEKDQLYLSAGMQSHLNVITRQMENEPVIRQRQNNYSPAVVVNYKLRGNKTIRFNFSGNYQNPTIEQLQPIPDNTNPLHIRLGNPELRPSFQQQYNLSYTTGYKRGSTASFSMGFYPNSNSIVNAVYFDANRRMISQYINVDGIYSLRSNWNFSRVVNRSGKGYSWGFSGNATMGRQVFFDQTVIVPTRNYAVRQTFSYSTVAMKSPKKNQLTGSVTFFYNRNFSAVSSSAINSRNLGISPKLSMSYRLMSFADLSVSYQANYQQLNYNAGQNHESTYTDHVLSGQLETEISERFSIGTFIGFHHNGRLPSDAPGREMTLLNLNASLRVFANQRGLVSFSAVDLLNNYTDVNRMVGDNYIEDVQIARQRNYFTISFQYNWTKTTKKKAS